MVLWCVRTAVKLRVPLLILAAVLFLAAYPSASRLDFDRSIENMFAPGDPLLVPYRKLKRTFGGNEIALAAYVDKELLTPEGMQRVATLSQQMKQVDGVESVLSLTETPLGTGLIDSPARESFLELFEGYTIGADHVTTAVVCMLRPDDRPWEQVQDTGPDPNAADPGRKLDRAATVRELRRVIQEHDPTGELTGEPVMVVEGFGYIESDGERLGRWSTVCLIITIVLCFRSLRWVIVPVVVVNLTLWLTQAVLVSSGFRLSMVSSMLWAIVTVTGIAMVIHIIVRFRELRAGGLVPRDALVAAGAALAVPIVWTCFTDAAGFGSLLWARVGVVHDFGVMMAIGSLVAIISAILVIPGLGLIGGLDADPKRAWGERNLDEGLHQVVGVTERFPRALGLLTVVVTAVAGIGYTWLEVETDFTKNFRASTPIVQSYQFVESRLGGAGVWDVMIPAPEEIDAEFLTRVRRLQQRLRSEVMVENQAGETEPGLTKVLTITDTLDAFASVLGMQNVPDAMTENALTLFATTMPTVMDSLVGVDPLDENRRYLRIMLRSRERQRSDQKAHLINQVESICTEEFAEAEVTGFLVLLTDLVNSMVQDQWRTFSIAMVAIGLLMWAAFRSLTLAIVALIPNALPIVVLTGLMGWLGLRINMGAAMIAAVSLGLSIDCSIHYITAFLRLRREGKSLHECIDRVHQSVGRAMFFSTLALIVGFSTLCLSNFVPTIYFGVLVSLSMIGGLVGNLVVLPVLLQAVHQRRGIAGGPPAPADRAIHAASRE